MEKFIKELGREIAEKLIKFEDQKGDTRRPEGQTLYQAETENIMEKLTKEVLFQMGYEENGLCIECGEIKEIETDIQLMEKEKQKCFNEIRRAIEHAMECGYTVVVGSDPEGNNWNTINPQYMKYGDEREGYIAIGVFKEMGDGEGEIFKNICFGHGPCNVEIPDGESLCDKCKLDPKNAWAINK